MSELEQKILEAIDGHDYQEVREALLLILHKHLGIEKFMNFLVPIRH